MINDASDTIKPVVLIEEFHQYAQNKDRNDDNQRIIICKSFKKLSLKEAHKCPLSAT